MKKNMICITCPIGCELEVEVEGDEIFVSGNNCKRGEVYAKAEVTAPKRMITSIINVEKGKYRCASVKTTEPVDKNMIFEILDEIKKVSIEAPINIGDVIIEDIFGTGVDIVATSDVAKV